MAEAQLNKVQFLLQLLAVSCTNKRTMWKQNKGSRSSVSQENERENLIRGQNLSPDSTSPVTSEFGNLSLSHGGSESEEAMSMLGSPTKETPSSGSGKDSKKSGSNESKTVRIEVLPGDFKKTVKKRPKHGHDRSQVEFL